MGIAFAITLYLLLSGNRTVLLPVFSGILILGVLIFLRMFAFYFSGANGEYKKLRGTKISATFRENGINFGTATETLKWKDLYKFRKTGEAFLFFLTKEKYIICPSSDLDGEIIDFINEKLKEFRINGQ
ncbi:MAG: YcxB family protein [Spirochaetales bacterium]|nr:YcxB family protein [Spirochaetales bacterium]